jgi:hypothetical protein
MAVYTSAVAWEIANAADGKEVFPIGGFTGSIPERRSVVETGRS